MPHRSIRVCGLQMTFPKRGSLPPRYVWIRRCPNLVTGFPRFSVRIPPICELCGSVAKHCCELFDCYDCGAIVLRRGVFILLQRFAPEPSLNGTIQMLTLSGTSALHLSQFAVFFYMALFSELWRECRLMATGCSYISFLSRILVARTIFF